MKVRLTIVQESVNLGHAAKLSVRRPCTRTVGRSHVRLKATTYTTVSGPFWLTDKGEEAYCESMIGATDVSFAYENNWSLSNSLRIEDQVLTHHLAILYECLLCIMLARGVQWNLQPGR